MRLKLMDLGEKIIFRVLIYIFVCVCIFIHIYVLFVKIKSNCMKIYLVNTLNYNVVILPFS